MSAKKTFTSTELQVIELHQQGRSIPEISGIVCIDYLSVYYAIVKARGRRRKLTDSQKKLETRTIRIVQKKRARVTRSMNLKATTIAVDDADQPYAESLMDTFDDDTCIEEMDFSPGQRTMEAYHYRIDYTPELEILERLTVL